MRTGSAADYMRPAFVVELGASDLFDAHIRPIGQDKGVAAIVGGVSIGCYTQEEVEREDFEGTAPFACLHTQFEQLIALELVPPALFACLELLLVAAVVHLALAT